MGFGFLASTSKTGMRGQTSIAKRGLDCVMSMQVCPVQQLKGPTSKEDVAALLGFPATRWCWAHLQRILCIQYFLCAGRA